MHNAVRAQLLASRLSDSMERGVLGEKELPESMVLQLTAITDVGVSAQTLLDTLYARRTEVPIPTYPRQMLRLELSDGFSEPLVAFEYARIDALVLGETLLGCKLRVQRAQREQGIVFLTPATTSVLGGVIPDLARRGEQLLEDALCAKLQVPPRKETVRKAPAARVDETKPVPPQRAFAQTGEQPPICSQPATRAAQPTLRAEHPPRPNESEPLTRQTPEPLSDHWDIDAEEALLEAELAMMNTPEPERAQPSRSKYPANDQLTAPVAHSIQSSPPPAMEPAAPMPSSDVQKSELLKHLDSASMSSTPPATATSYAPSSSGDAPCRLKIPRKHEGSQTSSIRPSPAPIELSSDTEPDRTAECIVLSDSDSVG